MFCKANVALNGVDLGDGQPSSYAKDDVFVASYGAIRDYVIDNVIELI